MRVKSHFILKKTFDILHVQQLIVFLRVAWPRFPKQHETSDSRKQSGVHLDKPSVPEFLTLWPGPTNQRLWKTAASQKESKSKRLRKV